MNHRGISSVFIILSIVLFAAAVSAAYWYGKNSNPTQEFKMAPSITPTSSPIAISSPEVKNSKKYENKEYKFSIEYPRNWTITNMTGQLPNEKDLDYQLLNGSDWRCVEKDCVELTLKQNINIERMKMGSGDAGYASSASAEVKTVNGKEVTTVVRHFSALNPQTNEWVYDEDKSYFVYIPHKSFYLQLRGNFKNKEQIDKIAASYYEFP